VKILKKEKVEPQEVETIIKMETMLEKIDPELPKKEVNKIDLEEKEEKDHKEKKLLLKLLFLKYHLKIKEFLNLRMKISKRN